MAVACAGKESQKFQGGGDATPQFHTRAAWGSSHSEIKFKASKTKVSGSSVRARQTEKSRWGESSWTEGKGIQQLQFTEVLDADITLILMQICSWRHS